jgi:hypothetical protein
VAGGETDRLPDAEEEETVVSAVQLPHSALLEESLYWISKPVMALFVPPDAPLHESAAFPSATVGETEQADGAPQAVVRSAELVTV